MLGSVQVVFVFVASAAGLWLWRKSRSNGARRALTWDCGYAGPTARMQYTSGSFAGLAGGWFAWLLQPERTLHRPRGPLPTGASRIERIPETVLEYVVAPVTEAVMRVSAAVRWLQHGRLQAYILYVLAGLVAVGMLVLFGGKP
jgi:hydrogenase-4 component B